MTQGDGFKRILILRTLKDRESLREGWGAVSTWEARGQHQAPVFCQRPSETLTKPANPPSRQTNALLVCVFQGSQRAIWAYVNIKSHCSIWTLFFWQRGWPCLPHCGIVWGAVRRNDWETAVEDNVGETGPYLTLLSRLLVLRPGDSPPSSPLIPSWRRGSCLALVCSAISFGV